MLNKAFTLVEMLVALAVGSIVIMATYASYEMVNTQYHKNIDIANMHTSGRSIMQMIERDVRMAGFEYRYTFGTNKGKKAFASSIAQPLEIIPGVNKCCNEVKVIYDYFNEDTKVVKRIQIHYFTKEHNTPKKGKRYRLYKQVNDVLPLVKAGTEGVLADFVEGLRLSNIGNTPNLFTGAQYMGALGLYDTSSKAWGVQEKLMSNVGKATPIVALAFSPNGLLYVGAHGGFDGRSYKGFIRPYDTVNKIWGTPIPTKDKFSSSRRVPVKSLVFGPDGVLYMGSQSLGILRSYDPISKTWGIQEKFTKYRKSQGITVDALAFGPDGLLYVGSSIGGILRTYNPVSKKWGKRQQLFRYSNSSRVTSIFSLTFGTDGLLYVGSYTGLIRSYNPVNNRWGDNLMLKSNSGRAVSVDALAFGADGLLYAGSESGDMFRTYDPISKKWSNVVSAVFKDNKGRAIGIKALAVRSKKSGKELLVSIKLTLRSEKEHSNNAKIYKYDLADYKFEADDKYKHDVFTTSVLVRNLAL